MLEKKSYDKDLLKIYLHSFIAFLGWGDFSMEKGRFLLRKPSIFSVEPLQTLDTYCIPWIYIPHPDFPVTRMIPKALFVTVVGYLEDHPRTWFSG